MDKLALLHPSLGLAFTEHLGLMPNLVPYQPECIIQGNKAADQLPDGCDGCREGIGGRLVCCINQEDEE